MMMLVQLSLCLIKHRARKTYGEMNVWLHTFLALSLDEGDCSSLNSSSFTSGKEPQSQCAHSGGGKDP